MRGISLASLLIPQEAYALLIVIAGMLIMFGQRRMALAIFTFIFLSVLLPPLLEPALAELPDWVVWGMLAMFALSILRLILGPDVWANMWGTLLGNLLTGLVMGLLRLPGRLIRAVLRLVSLGGGP